MDRSVELVREVDGNDFFMEVSGVDLKFEEAQNELSPVNVSDKIGAMASSLSGLVKNVSESIMSDAVKNNSSGNLKKIKVDFNAELSAEGGVWFVAKGEAKAGITISLEWEV